MYETFEHTADLGLRVRAPDLDSLFRDAAEGLFAMIADGIVENVTGEELTFHVAGERRDYLLFDWLNELLYTFDARLLLLGRFRVRVDEKGVRAKAVGQPLDPSTHRLLHEVKAITYHGLRVERQDDGWLAEVIVDI